MLPLASGPRIFWEGSAQSITRQSWPHPVHVNKKGGRLAEEFRAGFCVCIESCLFVCRSCIHPCHSWTDRFPLPPQDKRERDRGEREGKSRVCLPALDGSVAVSEFVLTFGSYVCRTFDHCWTSQVFFIRTPRDLVRPREVHIQKKSR